MGRAHTMAQGTRFFRVPAGEIRAVAFLATRKTAFAAGLLCPSAMDISVRPVDHRMFAGVRVYGGITVLFTASPHTNKDEPEEKNHGPFHLSYR